MGIIFDLIAELAIVLALGGIFYLFEKMSTRHWLWLVGIAAIVGMMWLRGFDRLTTYPVAAGWAALLYWFDGRMAAYDEEGREGEPAHGPDRK